LSLIDLDRAKSILMRERLDAVLSSRPENVTYVSGVADNLECRIYHETRTYALLFAAAAPALVVPWFEVPYLQSRSPVEAIVEDRIWSEPPSPERPAGRLTGNVETTLARVLRSHHLSTGRIGIDERALPLAAYEQLQAELPLAQFIPATYVFEEMRLIKTPEEISRIKRAAGAVERGYEVLAATLKVGVTERELTIQARDAILDAGADDVIFNFVTVGARAGIDHVSGSDVRVQAGENVKCDIGAHYGGYCSDIGRSFACGEVDRAQKRIYRRIRETEERVIAAAKPGTLCADLYDIYLNGMQEGYGETPWDMIGHGIGLEVHEIPVISPLEKRRLEPGMMLCVEIGYLDPGRQGFHLEDMLLVTRDGNLPLTSILKNNL
jgi:Xaa-Pro aminopeptidase